MRLAYVPAGGLFRARPGEGGGVEPVWQHFSERLAGGLPGKGAENWLPRHPPGIAGSQGVTPWAADPACAARWNNKGYIVICLFICIL